MNRWLIVAVVSLVACGGSERTAQMMVQQVPVPDSNETLHAEGAEQFVELYREEEDAITAQIGGQPRKLAVEPVRYSVLSYTRVCRGDWSSLDVPTRRCAQRLAIERRASLIVQTQIGSICEIIVIDRS